MQGARAVLMVRPASFGWNPQTQASNRFQRAAPDLAQHAPQRARDEFDALTVALRTAGVRVFVADDRPHPACPDAVFPNNWVSTHADGTVVLYPMLAANRRLERRPELLARLVEQEALRIGRLLDLTHHELAGHFLEGTGSVVFDHEARVAYAALSPRTHAAPLAELCAELGFRACVFGTADAAGAPVYHTNVLLAIGTRFAVVAAAAIAREDRERVVASLGDSGREVVEIDLAEMASFAGNVLELRAAHGARVLAMSAAAAAATAPASRELLQACVDAIVVVPVPTIETLGGGSVRCMIAEIFLPR